MVIEPSTPAQDLVRQLLVREVGKADDPTAIALAMQRLCTRVSANLRRSLGDDGYSALLDRAIALTQSEYPVLISMRSDGNAGASIERVIESVNSHGATLVTAAISALLATLADMLSGLIGMDMVSNLIDHDAQPSTSSKDRPAQ